MTNFCVIHGPLTVSWIEGEPCPMCKEERMAGRGDPRFHAELAKLGELHDRKQEDYGTGTDPFANVRASEEFGVPPWVGALVRLNDKVTRLKSFALKGQLANESAVDSMLDIAVYAVIAKVLYDEETGHAVKPDDGSRKVLDPGGPGGTPVVGAERVCGDPDCGCSTAYEESVRESIQEAFLKHEEEGS